MKSCTVYGALWLTATIYGLWHLVAKLAVSGRADPVVFAFYRCFGGTVLLFLLLRCMPGLVAADKTIELTSLITSLPRRDVQRFLILGFLMAGNVCGFIVASSFLSALTCSIFQPTMPILAMFFSFMLGVEDISIYKLVGVTCSISGAICVVVLSKAPRPEDWMSNMDGMFFLALNVTSTAAYFVILKDIVRSYQPVFTTAITYLVASIIILFAAIVKCGPHAEAWLLGREQKAWLGLVYAVLFTTAFNYSITAWANKQTTPTTVTVFATLQPMVAAFFSWSLLGVSLTHAQVVGGMLIIVGLLVIVRGQVLEANSVENKPLAH